MDKNPCLFFKVPVTPAMIFGISDIRVNARRNVIYIHSLENNPSYQLECFVLKVS